MKVTTTTLTGAALDYAVALAEGLPVGISPELKVGTAHRLAYPSMPAEGVNPAWWHRVPRYAEESAGDDIIDREGITTIRCDDDYGTDPQGFCTNVRIPVWALCWASTARKPRPSTRAMRPCTRSTRAM